MVLSVDEARSAPAGRYHRLLRRTLLIAALAAGGWLLSILFATSASAAEEPTTEHSVTGTSSALPADESTGLFGAVETALTGTVVDAVDHTAALGHAVTGTAEQVVARAEQPRPIDVPPAAHLAKPAEPAAAPRPAAAQKPPVTPAFPAFVATAPVHHPRPAAPPSRADHAPAPVTEHAGRHTPTEPAKSPAPASPGATSAAGTADSAGNARGLHAVLSASAPLLPPTAAGFTTRSRAADTTGRISGLPATSPD